MRVDSLVAGQLPGLAVNTRGNSALGDMAQGDKLTGRVIFAGDDLVHLKTDDGVLLRARLEGDMQLQVGDLMHLEVVETEGDTVYLAVEAGDEVIITAHAAADAAQQSAGQSELSAAMDVLTRLEYPPSQTIAERLVSLLAQYPDMAPEEAAFLAAADIPETEIPAARALYAGDAAIDNLLAELGETLGRELPNVTLSRDIQALPAEGAKVALMAELLGVPEELAAELVAEREPVSAGRALPQEAAPRAEGQPVAQDGAEAAGKAVTQPRQEAGQPANGITEDRLAQSAQSAARGEAPRPGPGESALTEKTVTMLKSLPEFAEAPEKTVVRVARALADTVDALIPADKLPGQRVEANLPELVRGLFADPDRESGQVAAKLQTVREELGTRLAVLGSLAGAEAERSQASAQMQRIIQHADVTSRMDQFTYVQIPIRLEGQRETADLYLYKNKKGGGGKIDPENVRMLLALDMQRLGHLEAFVTITGRDVSLSLRMERADAIGFVRDMAPELTKLLAGAGFRLTETRVQPLEEKTELADPFAPRRGETRKGPGVDYVV